MKFHSIVFAHVRLIMTSISIKWKLLGAFFITASFPFCLMESSLSYGLQFTLAFIVAIVLGSYSNFRILGALDQIKKNLQQISSQQEKNESLMEDELSAVTAWTDQFVKNMETKVEGLQIRENEKENTNRELKKIVYGNLSTGEATTGMTLYFDPLEPVDHGIENYDCEKNESLFLKSIQHLKTKLQKMKDMLGDHQDALLIDFQIYFLDDSNLIKGFKKYNLVGVPLDQCIDSLFNEFIQKLEGLNNDYIRSRRSDILDIKHQLYRELHHCAEGVQLQKREMKDKIVLVPQLLPSDVLHLSNCGVKGIVAKYGTASSHAQILLESLAISSLSDIKDFRYIRDDIEIGLDTFQKRIVIKPSEEEKRDIEKARSLSVTLSKPRYEKICDQEGHPILVKANINMVQDLESALKYGADGIGLFRSEMSYLNRDRLPSEEDLFKDYHLLCTTFSGQPITMRMLDIGGDKLVGFDHMTKEENPCMGKRSMRLLNDHRSLFRTQYRAMRRAAHENCSIIFPMVSSKDELFEVMEHVQQYESELVDAAVPLSKVRFGLMVEVPSIVEKFDDYVKDFDVFNIGTNDLAQYTLAADRNNKSIEKYYSPLHLSLIHI